MGGVLPSRSSTPVGRRLEEEGEGWKSGNNRQSCWPASHYLTHCTAHRGAATAALSTTALHTLETTTGLVQVEEIREEEEWGNVGERRGYEDMVD